MPALMYSLLNYAGIQSAGSNKNQQRWSRNVKPELVKSRGQDVKENKRSGIEADGGEPKSSGKTGYPKRRIAEQEENKTQFQADFLYENRRTGPRYKVNGKSKDVWVNRNSRFADKVFDEEVELSQVEQGDSLGSEPKGTVSDIWASSGSGDEKYAWPERRAAMVELQTAENLGAALHRIGGRLEVTDLNAVLRRFGRLGKWKESVVLFEWMKKHNKLTAPTYTSYFSVLGKACQVDKALQAFEELEDQEIRSNLYLWNSMISTLISNGKVDKAFQFFRLMKEEGLVPDRITYSTMISGCSKALGGFYKAQELVKEMRDKDLRLDSVMYGALINVCASNHMVEEARATFDEMQAEGFVPNLFHYCSLLNSYALKGWHEQAEQVLADIKSAGLKPNKVVFNSLINAYARAKLPLKARGIFEEMTEYGLQPDMISFCSLMDAYAKAGQVEEAQQMFDQMKASGLKPGSNSYSILISAYGKSGKINMIRKLSQEIDHIIGGDLDIHLFNSLLKVYCQAGVMDGVMDILRKMDTQGCSPNRITFHILMAYFCKEDLCDLAIRTFQDMEARGYPANETSYTILIQGFVRYNKVKDSLDLLAEMHKRGVSPTKIIYQELICSCLGKSMLTEAQQVFQLMKASRHVVSQAVLESYMDTFAEEGMIDVVQDVLGVMTRAGYKLNQEMWDELLFRSTEQKQFDLVITVVEDYEVYTSRETLNILIDKMSFVGRQDLLQRLKKVFENSRR